ncbi:MAG: hypothetical protein A2X11_02185 [Bacteroidetes bacterium GWE2_42_24]|nr:MAG: hypothetical protein A2X11_02185 [Bacteroidetes bacterium GWE2_42_24]OFY25721.1 MAG: hypothetical protein A2X09_13370 [Bacteroidetes bacterium GWF2_43_11]PKP27443.1 MAG: hypothetical protein CVU06_02010 [Bacteroidetes bacterium HGW-Bacteroidetes-22]
MNLKMFSLTVVLTMMGIVSMGQKILDSYHHYTGKIGNSIDVTLDIVIAGNLAEGIYSYSNIQQPDNKKSIQITGRWDVVKKHFRLEEFGNPDGSTFILTKLENGLSGTWKPAEQDVELPCSLAENYNDGSLTFKTYSKALSHTLFPMMKTSPRASYRIVIPEAIAGAQRNVLDSINKQVSLLYFNRLQEGEGFDNIIEAERTRYFQQYVDQNLDNYTTTDQSNTFCWDKHLSLNVMHNENDILSLGVKLYAFTGSGKGMIVKKYLTMSAKTGQRFSLNELFDGDYKGQIENLILNEVKVKFNLGQNELLTEKGFFAENVSVTENFYLTSNSIGFCYNPYEIAGASVGAIEIVIPISSIASYLKPGIKL